MHASLIMHTQGSSCAHMNLPKNPNFIFFLFLLLSSQVCSFLVSFPFFMFSKLLFHMFNCHFASHILDLGFYYFDAMDMHSHAHA